MMLADEYVTSRLGAAEAVRAEQDRERERRRRERVEELLQVRAEGLIAKRLARARAARDEQHRTLAARVPEAPAAVAPAAAEPLAEPVAEPVPGPFAEAARAEERELAHAGR